jgi:hypothetical protein
MEKIIIILFYVAHVFTCRYLYIKIINKDKCAEFPIISIMWFIPIAGIIVHIFMYVFIFGTRIKISGWFVSKSKK